MLQTLNSVELNSKRIETPKVIFLNTGGVNLNQKL